MKKKNWIRIAVFVIVVATLFQRVPVLAVEKPEIAQEITEEVNEMPNEDLSETETPVIETEGSNDDQETEEEIGEDGKNKEEGEKGENGEPKEDGESGSTKPKADEGTDMDTPTTLSPAKIYFYYDDDNKKMVDVSVWLPEQYYEKVYVYNGENELYCGERQQNVENKNGEYNYIFSMEVSMDDANQWNEVSRLTFKKEKNNSQDFIGDAPVEEWYQLIVKTVNGTTKCVIGKGEFLGNLEEGVYVPKGENVILNVELDKQHKLWDHSASMEIPFKYDSEHKVHTASFRMTCPMLIIGATNVKPEIVFGEEYQEGIVSVSKNHTTFKAKISRGKKAKIDQSAESDKSADISKIVWSTEPNDDKTVLSSDKTLKFKYISYDNTFEIDLNKLLKLLNENWVKEELEVYLYAVDEYNNVSEEFKITIVCDNNPPKVSGGYYVEEKTIPNNYYRKEKKVFVSCTLEDQTGIEKSEIVLKTKSGDKVKTEDLRLDSEKSKYVGEVDITWEDAFYYNPFDVYIKAYDVMGNWHEVMLPKYLVDVAVTDEIPHFREDGSSAIFFSHKEMEPLGKKALIAKITVSNDPDSGITKLPDLYGIIKFKAGSDSSRIKLSDGILDINVADLYESADSCAETIAIVDASNNVVWSIDVEWDNVAPQLEQIEYDGRVYNPCNTSQEEDGQDGGIKEDSNQEDKTDEGNRDDKQEEDPEEDPNHGSNDDIDVKEEMYQIFIDDSDEIWLTVTDEATEVANVQYAITTQCELPKESTDNEAGKVVVFEDCITDSKGRYGIPISGDAKGFVYVKVSDVVRNEETVYVVGVICETESKHKSTAGITFSGLNSSKNDNEGNALFKQLDSFDFVVTDSYSGISKVEWSITGADGGQSVTDEISFKKNDKPKDSQNSTDESETEYNIRLKYAKKIDMRQLEGNGIKISIKLTDNVGHETVINKTISIDKTKPVINMSYKGAEADSTYRNIYKDNRQAVIVIKERNFKASDAKITINSSTGKIPNVSEWTQKKADADPKQTTYTATITFAEDGEYDINVTFTDMAGNVADAVKGEKFVIDKTVPQMDIEYNNVPAHNNSFYADTRIALITVKEQNFDPSRITIQGIDVGNGTGSQTFSSGTWSSVGDVHRIAVEFSADGTYRFAVSGKDKAGNDLESYTSDTFIVDKIMPEVFVTGVEDKSANNKSVIPVIEFRDRNYNRNGTVIELRGANRGILEVKGEAKSTDQGQIFTFDAFSEEKEADDLYTLLVSHSDMAGNKVEKKVTFSLNRYGSVYVFKGNLGETAGKYVNTASGIEVEEINVDRLVRKTINVVMAFNGETKSLTEGVDYRIIPHEEDNMWSRYTYRFDDSLFKQDGTYKLILYSVDNAGNNNSTSDLTKEAEIQFGVDNTAPTIFPVNLESGVVYNEDVRRAIISIADNFVLQYINVFVNGKQVEISVDGDKISFELPGMDSAQTIRIVAQDIAGNESVYEMSGLLITRNIIVRWTHNVPVMIATLAGAFVIAAIGITLPIIIIRKRKRSFY